MTKILVVDDEVKNVSFCKVFLKKRLPCTANSGMDTIS